MAGARGSRHRTSVTGSGHNNRLNFPDHFFTIVPIFESSKHLAPPNNGGARVHARYSSAPNTIKTKKHRPLCCELSFSLSISGEPLANKSFSVEGTEREEVWQKSKQIVDATSANTRQQSYKCVLVFPGAQREENGVLFYLSLFPLVQSGSLLVFLSFSFIQLVIVVHSALNCCTVFSDFWKKHVPPFCGSARSRFDEQ